MGALLEVTNLSVAFTQSGRTESVLHQVSFSLYNSRTLALVGESGSGKSVTSLAIMGLLPDNAHLSGRIRFQQSIVKDMVLNSLSQSDYQSIRGARIAMIFQEPMSSLNPLLTIGDQLEEPLILHSDCTAAERRRKVLEMLDMVEIPAAQSRMSCYPHELSGGMRQRVMIAQALMCNPTLLIADEPTTALDVTIQAQILALMRRLQREMGMSILFITHDMGVVAEIADDVAVMYAGSVVEEAPVVPMFASPAHPYTQGLLASIPQGRHNVRTNPLTPIPGSKPALNQKPHGCAFAPRCHRADMQCQQPVRLKPYAVRHQVACIHAAPAYMDKEKRHVG